MIRRDFLRSTTFAVAGLALPKAGRLLEPEASPRWRVFEVTTRVEIVKPSGVTRVWLPTPLIRNTPFQRTLSNNTFTAKQVTVQTIRNDPEVMGIVAATFPAGTPPVMVMTSRVALRDFTVDLAAPRHSPQSETAELRYFLQPTKLIPTDGLVKEQALKITSGATTDVDKARAIYEWIVDNTFRDSEVRGCGRGDIRFMLDSGDLDGKCADLNALYVGLARAAGLPARDVYGIRVAKSELGYKSLGAASATVTKAQHCRAEVYLQHYGWVPVDPADVRKVALEEPPGNRPLSDEMVKRARQRLFGSWEMNWMAYNFSHDVELPGSTGAPVGFLMYPQAETGAGRLDSLDAENFKYEITAKEI